ncbi:MAG: rod shape-determining protein MreC [Acidobacteriota bacterium]
MKLFFKKRVKDGYFLLLIVLINIVLISIQVPKGNGASFFEKSIFAIFTPVNNLFHELISETRGIVNEYLLLKKIHEENKRLREENLKLKFRNLDLEEKIRQIKTEKAVNLSGENIFSGYVRARTIGIDPSNPFENIYINKGLNDKIKKNQCVIDYNGNLVGKTIEPIGKNYSKVQLATSKNSAVGAKIKDKNIIGILGGTGSYECSLNYIRNIHSMGKNEEVETSGYDMIFPKGIKIGRVVKVENTNSLFKKISVKPYFVYEELEEVLVIFK